jgi:hypothetical protein
VQEGALFILTEIIVTPTRAQWPVADVQGVMISSRWRRARRGRGMAVGDAGVDGRG